MAIWYFSFKKESNVPFSPFLSTRYFKKTISFISPQLQELNPVPLALPWKCSSILIMLPNQNCLRSVYFSDGYGHAHGHIHTPAHFYTYYQLANNPACPCPKNGQMPNIARTIKNWAWFIACMAWPNIFNYYPFCPVFKILFNTHHYLVCAFI